MSKMKGTAVAPTQGRTRNQPATAPTPKKEIGKGLPNTYFGNSRGAVHKNLDTKGKHD